MDERRQTRARPLFLVLALALSATVIGALGAISLAGARGDRPKANAAPGGVAVAATSSGGGVVVSVDPGVSGRVIPAGFLGLSFEYWALENMAGRDPGGVNPVLVRLIR